MRRDAEVARKCLLRSPVVRKERDRLERALEDKERGKGRMDRDKIERRGGYHGGPDRLLIVTEQ